MSATRPSPLPLLSAKLRLRSSRQIVDTKTSFPATRPCKWREGFDRVPLVVIGHSRADTNVQTRNAASALSLSRRGRRESNPAARSPTCLVPQRVAAHTKSAATSASSCATSTRPAAAPNLAVEIREARRWCVFAHPVNKHATTAVYTAVAGSCAPRSACHACTRAHGSAHTLASASCPVAYHASEHRVTNVVRRSLSAGTSALPCVESAAPIGSTAWSPAAPLTRTLRGRSWTTWSSHRSRITHSKRLETCCWSFRVVMLVPWRHLTTSPAWGSSSSRSPTSMHRSPLMPLPARARTTCST